MTLLEPSSNQVYCQRPHPLSNLFVSSVAPGCPMDTLTIVDLKRKAHHEGNVRKWRRLNGILARTKAYLESWYSDIAIEVEAGISKNESQAV